jgi:hypothetical protein
VAPLVFWDVPFLSPLIICNTLWVK